MIEGEWHSFDYSGDPEKGATLRCGPVFCGEIVRQPKKSGGYVWRAYLDGDCGDHSTMAKAKMRVEWEIWNRVRQMMPGYQKIAARQSTFDPANWA
ncbi:MAG TPA: hypothetical protein VGM36_04280 [Rhizomicrobium sp.]